jgi:exosortase A
VRAGALLIRETALARRRTPEVAGALLLGLGVLALLFRAEITAAVKVWEESTAYNHCFLVLPIAAYLAWERREMLAGVPIRPVPWGALAAVPLAALWLVAERLGIMEGRQFAALGLAQLMVLAVLGWRVSRKLAVPLLYLFFLVPFGAFIVPALQNFTWRFAVVGLDLLGIPNFAERDTIEISEGIFYVAEACAGLRFLIASLAFGTLYACLMYRSPSRRLLFIAAAMVVPVIANGFRALGVIWLGHKLGSAEAGAADHVLYGWLFFSIVILALAAAGAPFRQAQPQPEPDRDNPRGDAPRLAARSLMTAGAVLVLAAIGPGIAAEVGRAGGRAPPAVPPRLLADFGCTPSSAGPRGGERDFVCDAGRVALHVAVLSAHVTLRPVLIAQRRLTAGFAGDESRVEQMAIPGPVPQVWQLIEAPGGRAAATALWIAGGAASGGLRSRLRQAWISIAGPAQTPIVMAIIARPPGARALLGAFLQAHPALSARMARLSADAMRGRR